MPKNSASPSGLRPAPNEALFADPVSAQADVREHVKVPELPRTGRSQNLNVEKLGVTGRAAPAGSE
ncbi:MAG: hypothetical protein MZW92_08480 [Comamonadaceae bacterium]|nr:hypothetical protein [Comamonadaceae bacterium]